MKQKKIRSVLESLPIVVENPLKEFIESNNGPYKLNEKEEELDLRLLLI